MAVGHVRRMAALFDLVAEEYDQHVPLTAYARQFVPWLEVRPGDRFLDIGIGREAVAREAEEVGARVVGVDVSVAMLTKSHHPVALMDAQLLAVRTGASTSPERKGTLPVLSSPCTAPKEGCSSSQPRRPE